jgi:glycosyltransferase involved in cell wall biosynthesis
MTLAPTLLFPIGWPEPFGLVMIEAMSCGTPVLAFRRGSVPEVIEDGVSGFVVSSTEEAVAAAGSWASWTAASCGRKPRGALLSTLAEAKQLLMQVQQEVVAAQARQHARFRPDCQSCGGRRHIKDWRRHGVATLFGEVRVMLPRLACAS